MEHAVHPGDHGEVSQVAYLQIDIGHIMAMIAIDLQII